ncbi:methyltransferase domain-containing protein [Virgibacillus necropolis]|uniref:SAM-dependent methyltransferase n=1 Tax=Virgibacillus necropolis TaxID=163877 RepID=A0A221MEB1_9BACI|nr:methyltransferase domain-containing protein [Virgibacillus necropolis]ASN06016.1 SAM-dependent methyltransferase [Virgibacillus necropolis]
MTKDKLFFDYLKDVNQGFEGWDFSYISEAGRMGNELLSWSYGSMAKPLVQNAQSMLDMGTGGGEFLSMLRPFPKKVCATEAYKPNVPLAQNKLEPLGVEVFPIEEDTDLPFANKQFDLIINKHESYSPKELRRIISDHGIFLTQQVGGMNDAGINEGLGVPINDEFSYWNLETAVSELSNHSFEVSFSKEEFPIERFYDVGALVYYLKAIPWQVPDFSIEKYIEKLYQIHQQIKSVGYFDVKQHRFVICAKAI